MPPFKNLLALPALAALAIGGEVLGSAQDDQYRRY
jgi:hypothetical protein